nr:uncharacterized protein LOC102463579 [Pelodiscus sinensis]|eukprot:XP_006131170.1 uncharacterized protein LOC102463579 [Pelodiscus sinensis]
MALDIATHVRLRPRPELILQPLRGPGYCYPRTAPTPPGAHPAATAWPWILLPTYGSDPARSSSCSHCVALDIATHVRLRPRPELILQPLHGPGYCYPRTAPTPPGAHPAATAWPWILLPTYGSDPARSSSCSHCVALDIATHVRLRPRPELILQPLRGPGYCYPRTAPTPPGAHPAATAWPWILLPTYGSDPARSSSCSHCVALDIATHVRLRPRPELILQPLRGPGYCYPRTAPTPPGAHPAATAWPWILLPTYGSDPARSSSCSHCMALDIATHVRLRPRPELILQPLRGPGYCYPRTAPTPPGAHPAATAWPWILLPTYGSDPARSSSCSHCVALDIATHVRLRPRPELILQPLHGPGYCYPRTAPTPPGAHPAATASALDIATHVRLRPRPELILQPLHRPWILLPTYGSDPAWNQAEFCPECRAEQAPRDTHEL